MSVKYLYYLTVNVCVCVCRGGGGREEGKGEGKLGLCAVRLNSRYQLNCLNMGSV